MNLAIHGSRGGDTTVRISGNAFTISGTATTPINMGGVQEVNVETSALSIEEPWGGVRTSLIPRDGGNAYSGSVFTSYANENIQSNNFSEELKANALLAPNRIKSDFDVNPAFGGPLSRDKIWFYVSARYMAVNRYAPGLPFNRNAYLAFDDPKGFIYNPDSGSLGPRRPTTNGSTAVMTWQVTPRNKVAAAFNDQSDNEFVPARCHSQPLISRRASLWNHRPYYRYLTADHTSPLTSRLLIENHFFFWQFDGAFYRNNDPPQDVRVIGVNDTATGIKFRGWNDGGSTQLGPQRDVRWRTAVTYATGAHQFLTGFQFSNANNRSHTIGWNDVQYNVNNGIPTRIT